MNLDQLFPGAPQVAVSDLVYNSQAATPGCLFFCVPGFESDGHAHAADAVARGAAALVVERPLALGVPEVQVDSVREAMAPAAARFHGEPSKQLRVVGVTGTNGKTTTAFLVRQLLESAGVQCALLGTVKAVIGGSERAVLRTTAEAIDLQRDLAEMVARGDRACAIEVSSHALELHRADAVSFAAAIFTNLTQDHLDFHPDMESYFGAKRRLFAPGRARVPVVCVADEYGRRLAEELGGEAWTFGAAGARFTATSARFTFSGAEFELHHPGGTCMVRTRLPGPFNVLNALAAIAGAAALDMPVEQAAAALARAEPVPGRFQPVDEGQPFAVLVDYAHTPDSLENVLRAARTLTERRLLCVFGCGGDRDRGKRPLMGRIAAQLADRAIVTSDNPRSEEPEQIIAEIAEGAGPAALRITDRRDAIRCAVQEAEPGDVVVIAGKGHETGQEFAGGRRIPFDDVQVAQEALRAR